ncbi:uncharacterized protein LOC141660140 [Apium graveolens]|uniref:uncharacterized protein LOC141660140 n=1 Tax=Apium graveolens TaxID=4045 RepID=UPI003D7BCA66
MSLLTWNCRGLGKPCTVHFLKEVTPQLKPCIIFLSETLSKNNKVEELCKSLNYVDCWSIDAQGHSGGLALLCKNEGGCIVKDGGNHYIDFKIENEQVGRWWYTGFYRCSKKGRRRESWEILRNLASRSNLTWCVIGDFNNTMSLDEKRRGQRHPINLIDGFIEVIIECGLLDLGYMGEQFTWERSRGKHNWVQKRLDRGLANQEWFRFENQWLREKECENIVKNGWNEAQGLKIMEKIAWELNYKNGDGGSREKSFWLCEGDHNTIFFHKHASMRKRMNEIQCIKDHNGEWKDTDKEIQVVLEKYFGELFETSSLDGKLTDREWVNQVSDAENMELISEVIINEVKEVVFSIHTDKSLPTFFQSFWSVDGQDVTEFCRDYMATSLLPGEVNRKLVCLIPKVKMPETMAELRPISLCNMLVRIMSKVMSNRLKLVLNSIVSNKLSDFIVGRLLTDNALLAYEINHYMKKKTHGITGVAGLKVDISKACDRLEWDFVYNMMVKFSFHEIWVA